MPSICRLCALGDESYFLLTAIKLEDTDWSYEEAHEQLKQDLAAIADVLRAEETRKMVIVIEVRAWLFIALMSAAN